MDEDFEIEMERWQQASAEAFWKFEERMFYLSNEAATTEGSDESSWQAAEDEGWNPN